MFFVGFIGCHLSSGVLHYTVNDNAKDENMKVWQKQHNSKMCIICGLDNEYGLRAPFYTMEDGSVMTRFSYRKQHQSYPGRVHGGLITAMIDEMGLRALWAQERSEEKFGVTMSLETKYRKPVPYDCELIGKGMIVKKFGNFFVADCQITDTEGNVLANGTTKYLHLNTNKIAEGVGVHEEMCYLIPGGVETIG